MIYFIIISFFVQIIFSVVIVRQLEKIHKSIQNKTSKVAPKKIRTHSAIKTSNYDNSYNTRGYDQFKDKKTGLYEPQKPHGGIEIKKQKEA